MVVYRFALVLINNLIRQSRYLLLRGRNEAFFLFGGIIMKLENWNKNTAEVQSWLNTQDIGDAGQAIALSITLGNNCNDDDLRSTYWTAIRSIGSQYESFPKARRGRESALPDDIEVSATSVKNAVIAAFADISNAELLMTVVLPHGRTGGAYADINEFARVMGKKAYDALVKGYKENRWDGTMNGDIPALTPPPVKSTEGGEEEE